VQALGWGPPHLHPKPPTRHTLGCEWLVPPWLALVQHMKCGLSAHCCLEAYLASSQQMFAWNWSLAAHPGPNMRNLDPLVKGGGLYRENITMFVCSRELALRQQHSRTYLLDKLSGKCRSRAGLLCQGYNKADH
jgi:hypothetical protein